MPTTTTRDELDEAFRRDYVQLYRIADRNLDVNLRDRASASDVVQDAWVHAVERLVQQEEQITTSLSGWLRFMVKQSVQQLRRFHLKARKRSVLKEQLSGLSASISDSSASRLVEALSASVAGPSSVLMQKESHARVQELIEGMEPVDRQILTLRHVDCLTNQECAERLGINKSTASKRYLRALERLHELVATTSLC